jgi:hypothetical protein
VNISNNNSSWQRTGIGCLLYIVIFAGIAYGIRPWTAPYEAAGLGLWPGLAAAAFLTLAVGTFWEFLKRLFSGKDPRAEMLERARRSEVPETDGPVIASGKVRAAAGALKAPLSGTACVAYLYRMYVETRDQENYRRSQPMYWGYASRSFILDTQTRALRVMAVPQLEDEAVKRNAPEDRTRARHYANMTTFEETNAALGMLGVVGSAFSMVNALYTDDDGEIRRDWKLGGINANPETLLLEETVLPVGAQVTLTGTWSGERNAIVSSAESPLKVSTGSVDDMRSGALSVGNVGTVIWLLVTTAIGAGIVWAATLM